MRGKSEKNYVYYEKKIRILDQNMHGYKNTDLIDFASFPAKIHITSIDNIKAISVIATLVKAELLS